MTYCNDLLIWSRFEEAGYATAYGEDYLSLPDTFSRYQGFTAPPTHHYLRPFFLTGENQQGPLLCTKKLPSAVNVLNYAVDFAHTYANDSFFGFFWLNSYSHNHNLSPTLLDENIVDFFEKLTSIGVMTNTIVIFVSDHGIRYGVMRLPVESYYEERLPMLFMWTPTEFRNSYSESYTNSVQNQFRLTTPYDFYMTFWDILQMGNSQLTVPVSEACPQCTSLFSPIPKDRSCAHAMVRNVGYEATVEKDDNKYKVQGSIETISAYNTRGSNPPMQPILNQLVKFFDNIPRDVQRDIVGRQVVQTSERMSRLLRKSNHPNKVLVIKLQSTCRSCGGDRAKI
ncbi:hypothetical protein EVAR_54557_1 [Eumeta japonica]|uniref:Sulfatase N-terminal domain-containing protein n=1 Tax=Eumeta variegata TaxID=151549 RepID=A0A4C1ZV80_EUMVA|nr:hypothetical protein EVAR_54557_1 [Eumeta japonica]